MQIYILISLCSLFQQPYFFFQIARTSRPQATMMIAPLRICVNVSASHPRRQYNPTTQRIAGFHIQYHSHTNTHVSPILVAVIAPPTIHPQPLLQAPQIRKSVKLKNRGKHCVRANGCANASVCVCRYVGMKSTPLSWWFLYGSGRTKKKTQYIASHTLFNIAQALCNEYPFTTQISAAH